MDCSSVWNTRSRSCQIFLTFAKPGDEPSLGFFVRYIARTSQSALLLKGKIAFTAPGEAAGESLDEGSQAPTGLTRRVRRSARRRARRRISLGFS